MIRRGFTLFEVLVALAIVVILMGTLASTITIAFKQKRAAEEAVIAVRDTQTVGDIFAEMVSCATPPNPLSASPDSIVYQNYQTEADAASPNLTNTASGGIQGMNLNGTSTTGSYLFGPFTGDSVSVSFYTTVTESKAATASGVSYVEFRLSQQPDGRQALVRRVESNLLSDTFDNSTLPEEVLVTGVTSVSFQYYDGVGWADTWDSANADTSNMLPYAVKMVLTLEPVRANGPERTITRCATVWCAQKTVNDYNDAVDTADNNTSYQAQEQ